LKQRRYLSIWLVEDEGAGPVGHVVEVLRELGEVRGLLLRLLLHPDQQLRGVDSQEQVRVCRMNEFSFKNNTVDFRIITGEVPVPIGCLPKSETFVLNKNFM
jgi:hypothetical protein